MSRNGRDGNLFELLSLCHKYIRETGLASQGTDTGREHLLQELKPLLERARNQNAEILPILEVFMARELDLAWLKQDAARKQNVADAIVTEAGIDFLTGLFNRRGADPWLRGYEANRTQGRRHAHIRIDAVGLKETNDTRGERAGDARLQDIAEALRDSSRDSDLLMRSGEHADEFNKMWEFTGRSNKANKHKLRSAIDVLIKEFEDRGIRAYIGGAITTEKLDLESAKDRADEQVRKVKSLWKDVLEGKVDLDVDSEARQFIAAHSSKLVGCTSN